MSSPTSRRSRPGPASPEPETTGTWLADVPDEAPSPAEPDWLREADALPEEPGAPAAVRALQADKESAAIIGFTSAVAAFGAFFIPKSYGTSISLTGGPQAALLAFLLFYLSCIAITWWFYTRRAGGMLHDLERGIAAGPAPAANPAQ